MTLTQKLYERILKHRVEYVIYIWKDGGYMLQAEHKPTKTGFVESISNLTAFQITRSIKGIKYV